MPSEVSRSFPRDNDALNELHNEVALTLAHRLPKIGEVFAMIFGEDVAHAAMRALIVEASSPVDQKPNRRLLFDQLGWREFLDQADTAIDPLELTQLWRDGAEYAGQGLAPHEKPDHAPSLEERKARVETLIARAKIALDCATSMLGDKYDYIWNGAIARAAIDFGGLVSLEGLRLLSGLSLAAVRNAVSIGELRPNEAGNISSQEASSWLARRREFCPSRWKNLDDNQWPFDPAMVIIPDDRGMILVPEAGEGDAFVPDVVVRPARNVAGISITVGAKGEEVQHHDFYEALTALATMHVARWRRRNLAGNWGIVRARGAWTAVSKAEIDRQLANKLIEAF